MAIRLPKLAWVMYLFGMSGLASAQSRLDQPTDSTYKRGPYNLVLTVGGGLSYYSTHLGVPDALEQTHVNRFGAPAMLRAMWYPDHRLRIGLETGWTTMYSYKGQVAGEPAHMYVSLVPVLLLFSMPLAWLSGTERSIARRLSATAGTGIYFNRSRLNYAGLVRATTNSLGWMAALSYTHPVSRRLRIAGELKWYDAVAAENAAFTAEAQVIWRPFSW
ncbi:hypothetical protein [Spirosoma koreense]